MKALLILMSIAISMSVVANNANATVTKRKGRALTAEQAYEAALHAKWKAEDAAAESEYQSRHRMNISNELVRLGLNPSDFKEQGSYVMSRSVVCSEGHDYKRKAEYANYSNMDCATGDGESNFCDYSVLRLDCINRAK